MAKRAKSGSGEHYPPRPGQWPSRWYRGSAASGAFAARPLHHPPRRWAPPPRRGGLLGALLALLPLPAMAQSPPPKLVVVVSVDQLSADLFAEYRGRFRHGMARLLSGAVFPSGYQSHSATETCPGHSTILTGARPHR